MSTSSSLAVLMTMLATTACFVSSASQVTSGEEDIAAARVRGQKLDDLLTRKPPATFDEMWSTFKQECGEKADDV